MAVPLLFSGFLIQCLLPDDRKLEAYATSRRIVRQSANLDRDQFEIRYLAAGSRSGSRQDFEARETAESLATFATETSGIKVVLV